MAQRSSLVAFPPGIELRTCAAEGLIVLKAFAGRGQDRVDVERVIVRQTGKLDWTYIFDQLTPLACLVSPLTFTPCHSNLREDRKQLISMRSCGAARTISC